MLTPTTLRCGTRFGGRGAVRGFGGLVVVATDEDDDDASPDDTREQ